MVFSSYEFLLLFLPPVVVGFHLLVRLWSVEAALLWLVGASFLFYGYWSTKFLLLLVVLCTINAGLGAYLARGLPMRRAVLAFGIALNLGTLGYFKYFDFFISNINAMTGAGFLLHSVVLPIGISFFIFQKIAFLVDASRGKVAEFGILQFFLFVFFFPQLIAGPIVHHSEILPQLKRDLERRTGLPSVTLGLSILVVGLGKKVLVADGIAAYATPVFDQAAAGIPVPFVEAWCGTFAYALQLYFDFSGYSDMAIGLALLFGIRLPTNFASPYKATSLIEFWRRWHITLSRFLREYVYIPLGGNRVGGSRHLFNLFAVMVIGGLWHGAGWTFVVWGALHGAGLIVNQLWRQFRGTSPAIGGHLSAFPISRVATFAFVAIAWIPFRAADLDAAWNIFYGLFGLNGISLPDTYANYLRPVAPWLVGLGVRFEPAYLFRGISEIVVLGTLIAAVWYLPNTQELFRYRGPESHANAQGADPAGRIWQWRPNAAWAVALAGYAIICLLFTARGGEFLYFQF